MENDMYSIENEVEPLSLKSNEVEVATEAKQMQYGGLQVTPGTREK
jgi:hypothetical protein